MKNTISLLFIFVFFLPKCSNAEDYTKHKFKINFKYDTTYIKNWDNKLILIPTLIKKHISLDIDDILTNNTLSYKPNNASSIGLKVSYKWLGFSLGMDLPIDNERKTSMGETKKIDFQMSFNFRRIVLDFYSQAYKGLYLENTSSYNLFKPNIDRYYKRPDMLLLNLGFSAKYIWNNRKFSYKAAYDYTDQQIHSSGSFVIGMYGFINAMTADSSIIPQNIEDSVISKKIAFSSLSSFNAGISLGYIYSLVIKKHFFINLGVVPGVGIQTIYAENTTNNPSIRKFGGGLIIISRFALGYSNEKFFTALSVINGTINLHNKDASDINFGYGRVEFNMGYRFNVKRKHPKYNKKRN